MAEVAVPKMLPLAQDNALSYYKKAYEHAVNNQLHACNETRLSVVMNYTVFLVDVLDQRDKALDLCKATIAMAKNVLDVNETVNYDEVNRAVVMLMENVATWSVAPDSKGGM